MSLGSFLALCLSVVLLTSPSIKRAVAETVELIFALVRLTLPAFRAFGPEEQIFSPPRRPFLMRI